MLHELHVDSISFKNKKPVRKEAEKIKHRFLYADSVKALTPEEIVKAIESGLTIQPGVCPFPDQKKIHPFEGGTKKAYFKSQSLFMVDIDNDINKLPKNMSSIPPLETLDSILNKFKVEGLYPAFIIPSISSERWNKAEKTKNPLKFHCGFFSDRKVLSEPEAEKIIKGLISISPYADSIPSHPASLFYGTDKEALYLDLTAENKVENLLALGDSSSRQAGSEKENWRKKSLSDKSSQKSISAGSRNSTLYSIACDALKYYGPFKEEEARRKFDEAYLSCEQPENDLLDLEEKESIWQSAYQWIQSVVWSREDYLPKEEFDRKVKGKGRKNGVKAQIRKEPQTVVRDSTKHLKTSKQQTVSEGKNGEALSASADPFQFLLDQTLLEPEEGLAQLRKEMNSGRYVSIPTGIPSLDEFLDGGFYPGLHVLGAETGNGKTTLAVQIADFIASHGKDVLYFSLEMAPSAMQSRSLSRMSFQEFSDESDAVTEYSPVVQAQEIRSLAKNSQWDDRTRSTVNDLLAHYTEKISPHLKYVHAISGITSGQIVDVVSSYIKEKNGDIQDILSPEQQSHLPVVVVDYLQILKSASKQTEKEKIDEAVFDMKRLADDFLLPVLVISSFNRMSYKDPVDLGSFKESGGIEYTADTLLALQLYGMDWKENETQGQRAYRVSNLKKESGAVKKNGEALWMELKILKNRYGNTGTLPLDYYAKYNFFAEGSEKERLLSRQQQDKNQKHRIGDKKKTPF